MLNVIVVNLSSRMAQIIERACNISGRLKIVANCDTTMEAISIMEKERVDCFFFDPIIADNLYSGFDFINYVSPLACVVVSSNPNLALKAYDYRNVVDYLVAPIISERLAESINRLLVIDNKMYSTESINGVHDINYIFINVKKKLIRIDLDNICYISSKGDYITVYTDSGQFTSYGTLKSLLQKLPKDRFVDIHRSHIINLDHVVDIENNSVLIGKAVLPIARLKRKKFFENLSCI